MLSHMKQIVATKIIEDFMLMANETVAQEYCTEEIPFVYRTHDNPDPRSGESSDITSQSGCEDSESKRRDHSKRNSANHRKYRRASEMKQ